MSILIDAEDDFHRLNWTKTSKEAGLKSKRGLWPLNGGQVCKSSKSFKSETHLLVTSSSQRATYM